MSQSALAASAGISVEMVSRLERARCLPSVETLVRLSLALATSPNQMLGIDDLPRHGDAAHVAGIIDRLPAARRRDLAQIARLFGALSRKVR